VFVQHFDRDAIGSLVRTGLATRQRVILKAGARWSRSPISRSLKLAGKRSKGEGRVRLLQGQLRSLPREIPGVFSLRPFCITRSGLVL
jgi:hypothetical protein